MKSSKLEYYKKKAERKIFCIEENINYSNINTIIGLISMVVIFMLAHAYFLEKDEVLRFTGEISFNMFAQYKLNYFL